MFTVPFRIACEDAPLLVVQARVNGQGPFDFVLDTGNGAPLDLLVTPSFQRGLALAELPVSHPFPVVRLNELELGAWRLSDIQAGVLEAMDQIGSRIGIPLAGNLGYHLIRQWRIEIDYGQKVIRLGRDAWIPGGGTPFATGPGGAFIILACHVNDRGPFTFLVDTGASSTVLAPRLARELGLSGSPIEALGVQGDLAAETFRLGRFEVAGQVVENMDSGSVDVFDYTSQAAGTPIDGIIGYSFLRQFLVVIDYPGRRIGFSRGNGKG